MSRIVGIDFGTSNSSVAFHDGKSAQIIEMADGQRLLPSVLTFDDNNEPLVGRSAIAAGKSAPLRCFRHVKRLMGKPFIRGEHIGSQVVEGRDGNVALKGPDRTYDTQEIAAVIIAALLDAVEAKYEERPDGVVIGVPAGYKDPQKVAIKKAAAIAGIAPDRIWTLEEPKAAAIMYAQGRKKFSTILVYDWGGGTFDCTILRAKNGKLEEVGTRGNSTLGGKDVDELLARHAVRVWKDKYDVDLGVRDATMARIREESESTKIELTGKDQSSVRVPFVATDGAEGIRHMDEPVTLAEFEAMALARVDETFLPCRELMAEYSITPQMIDEVILVGGMTRIPLVRRRVLEEFGKKPQTKVSPEEAVALGAATYAAVVLENRGGDDPFVLKNKAAHTLAVETLNDIPFVVIRRGASLPAERIVRMTTSKDGAPVIGFHLLEGDDDKASRNTLLVRDYPSVEEGPAGGPDEPYKVVRNTDGAIVVTRIRDGVVVYGAPVMEEVA